MPARLIPRWIWCAAVLVVGAQAAAIVLGLSGALQGPARNIIPQTLFGGAIALVALAGYLLRYHSESFPPAPARLGVVLLTLLALALTGLYVLRVYPQITLPYDLASWSEPMFLMDIIKWRTGASLYLPPDDSNSATYTFAAPALTYFLAWLFGQPTSIQFYRLLQQLYLILAALFAASATWHLLRLAAPERFSRLSRLWLAFFALASFLFATNARTNFHNIFLHNDPLGVLATAIAFWLMMKHAVTRDPRWLWPMAVMPALAFLVKQYLAIWAVVYTVYLWLDGGYSLRRVVVFGAACFAGLGLTVAVCYAIWGSFFLYWVFEIMGSHIVSFKWLPDRFADGAWYVALGLVGGIILLRGNGFSRWLGAWIGWICMVLGGIYTGGITYSPTHLGPATIVGGCFFLAAVATLWPDEEAASESPARQWLQVGVGLLLALTTFAALGFTRRPETVVSPDLSRYVGEIEREFKDLPPERVLLYKGEWIYLRHNILMKDRAAPLGTHRSPHYGLIDRLRKQEYARILMHSRFLNKGNLAYTRAKRTGIRQELLAHYRPVRRIAPVQGMENWPYYELMMTEVTVLEPIPPPLPNQVGGNP